MNFILFSLCLSSLPSVGSVIQFQVSILHRSAEQTGFRVLMELRVIRRDKKTSIFSSQIYLKIKRNLEVSSRERQADERNA
jgi:hypothetical protein